MKNFPLLFVIFLVFIGLTAFAVSDDKAPENPLPASADLLDQLTDEFQYLVELSSTAQDRLNDREHIKLAQSVNGAFLKKNRELCQLIIERNIPAKREISESQQQSIISLIPNRDEKLNTHFIQLMTEEFENIDALIKQQKGLIEEREILYFVDEVLTLQEDFAGQIQQLGYKNQVAKK